MEHYLKEISESLKKFAESERNIRFNNFERLNCNRKLILKIGNYVSFIKGVEPNFIMDTEPNIRYFGSMVSLYSPIELLKFQIKFIGPGILSDRMIGSDHEVFGFVGKNDVAFGHVGMMGIATVPIWMLKKNETSYISKIDFL